MIPVVIGLAFFLNFIMLGAVIVVAALGALNWLVTAATPGAQRIARWLSRQARSQSLDARTGQAR